MAVADLIGVNGLAAAVLPVETGLAVWIVLGALAVGSVGVALASFPPSILLKKVRVRRQLRTPARPVHAAA